MVRFAIEVVLAFGQRYARAKLEEMLGVLSLETPA